MRATTGQVASAGVTILSTVCCRARCNSFHPRTDTARLIRLSGPPRWRSCRLHRPGRPRYAVVDGRAHAEGRPPSDRKIGCEGRQASRRASSRDEERVRGSRPGADRARARPRADRDGHRDAEAQAAAGGGAANTTEGALEFRNWTASCKAETSSLHFRALALSATWPGQLGPSGLALGRLRSTPLPAALASAVEGPPARSLAHRARAYRLRRVDCRRGARLE